MKELQNINWKSGELNATLNTQLPTYCAEEKNKKKISRWYTKETNEERS
jgi:hypothetical protein